VQREAWLLDSAPLIQSRAGLGVASSAGCARRPLDGAGTASGGVGVIRRSVGGDKRTRVQRRGAAGLQPDVSQRRKDAAARLQIEVDRCYVNTFFPPSPVKYFTFAPVIFTVASPGCYCNISYVAPIKLSKTIVILRRDNSQKQSSLSCSCLFHYDNEILWWARRKLWHIYQSRFGLSAVVKRLI
jgi:hypothetical protein